MSEHPIDLALLRRHWEADYRSCTWEECLRWWDGATAEMYESFRGNFEHAQMLDANPDFDLRTLGRES